MWKLLYRGTDHGFGAANFHAKCDGIKETLIVIKSSTEYIFGGYTGAQWSSNKCYSYDSNTFLFSLTNGNDIQRKINCSQPENAIFSHPAYGPIFGCNNLLISDYSNDKNSTYNLSNNFISTDYPNLLNNKNSSFITAEIEVYSK